MLLIKSTLFSIDCLKASVTIPISFIYTRHVLDYNYQQIQWAPAIENEWSLTKSRLTIFNKENPSILSYCDIDCNETVTQNQKKFFDPWESSVTEQKILWQLVWGWITLSCLAHTYLFNKTPRQSVSVE